MSGKVPLGPALAKLDLARRALASTAVVFVSVTPQDRRALARLKRAVKKFVRLREVVCNETDDG
jgi:transposase